MSETQQTITDWANITFGPASSNLRVAARANEEMAELLRCLSVDENHPKAGEEIADVYIVLCRLATMLEVNLDAALASHKARTPDRAQPCSLEATSANEIMAEVLWFVSRDSLMSSRSNLLALVLKLADLAHKLGVDLQAAVDEKMRVNRSRVWKLDGSGHGCHVRDKTIEG